MAFEFRLEKVMKFRSRIVDKHTRDVAAANRVVSAILEKLGLLEDDINELLQQNLTEMNRTMDVAALISRGQWLDHMECLHEDVTDQLNLAREELERHRLQLTRAWRDLEVLERLRQKQKNQWFEEQRKQENKELDEIGQIRADRKNREKVSAL